MSGQDSRSMSPQALNEQRRLAVRLRLDGVRLKTIRERTRLSLPTIIAAHKAYLAGGWEGVDTKPRGRSPGDGRKLDGPTEAAFLASLTASADAIDANIQAALIDGNLVREQIRALGGERLAERTLDHALRRWGLVTDRAAFDEAPRSTWRRQIYPGIVRKAARRGAPVLWLSDRAWSGTVPGAPPGDYRLFQLLTGRGRPRWLPYRAPRAVVTLQRLLQHLVDSTPAGPVLVLDGLAPPLVAAAIAWAAASPADIECVSVPSPSTPAASSSTPDSPRASLPPAGKPMTLTHLQRLEAESIHIMREVVAEADNPVMLYSIGKDSAVMLHLAAKAFFPAKPPFPLLHVDTTWKFREMYAFRERIARELGFELLVHINQEGLRQGINPFTHGSAIHTDVMKTQALKQALDRHGFDVAFGGARRDEEKSRAKERIFSFRSAQHRWEPKAQRPELWRLYNARKHKGESIRVFPISNWTELDIWQYIHLENIPIVPLYYAKPRPVVERDGTLIMVDDERMPLREGEVPEMRSVRFRTLGCYPLTGAVESSADTLPAIIQEMLLTTTSERQGRVIDHDQAASMEKKKQEGYF
jgi:sulfate adenylyltransferase subunit 2